MKQWAKYLNRQLIADTQTPNKHLKGCSIIRHQGHAIANYLTPWHTYQNSQNLQLRTWGHRNSHSRSCECQWCSQFGGFLQSWTTLATWPSHHSPQYLPKGAKSFCPHTNMQTGVYGSFIHECPNLEATDTSFSRWWINELWFVHIVEYDSAPWRHELSHMTRHGGPSEAH